MNKQELVAALAGKFNTPKNQASEMVDFLFDSFVETLKKGEDVAVFGFGTFSVQKRAARNGINPKTKEKIKIAAKKAVKFKAAKALKEAVK